MENLQTKKTQIAQSQSQAAFEFKLPFQKIQPVCKLLHRLYAPLMVILALIPLLNTIIFIASTGENVLSADYIAYANLIGSITRGDYNWLNYPRDTFVNTHFLAIPLLLETFIALTTHWNTYVSMFTGVGMAVLRVLLLWDAGSQLLIRFNANGRSGEEGEGEKGARSRPWFLLVVLSALTFGASQIDVFSFGQTSITWGFSFIGLALGIWCLVKVKSSWKFSLLISLAGIISCWSGAMGFLTWPGFFIGMVLLGKRNLKEYIALFGAAGISAIPYIYYLFIKPNGKAATSIIYSNFNFTIFGSVFGWPFSNGTGSNTVPTLNPQALTAGIFGIIFGVIGIILYLLCWNTPIRKQGVPAIVLLIYGVLSPFQILVFRIFIGSWYNTQLMIYWIGLAFLGYVFWQNRTILPGTLRLLGSRINRWLQKGAPWVLTLWVIAFFTILVGFWFSSNLTFEDKVLFLRNRSPAAASCLREYKTFPNLCKGVLFNNYSIPIERLGPPLEKNYDSVFAPDQVWTLQGDFAINGRVLVQQYPDFLNKYWNPDIVTQPLQAFPTASQPPSQGVMWTSDLGKTVLPWSHYKHLNLFVHAPDIVTWNITLPDNTLEATFDSAVTFSDQTPPLSGADGGTFKIFVQQEGQPDKLVFSNKLAPTEHNWQPLSFSLKDYAGKSISLRLTIDPGLDAFTDWGVFRYPRINLKLDPARMKPVQPDNLKQYIPQPSSKDLILNTQNTNLWGSTNAAPVSNPGDSVAKWQGINPATISYNLPINACLSDYSQIYFRYSLRIPGTTNNVARVYYKLNGNSNFQPEPIVIAPDLGAVGRQSYFYDLKLLSLDPKVCITGVSIQLLDLASLAQQPTTFEIADFRFIKNPNALAAPPPITGAVTGTDLQPATLQTLMPAYIQIDGLALSTSQVITPSGKTQLITGTDVGWLAPQPEFPTYWPISSGARVFVYSSSPQRVQFQMTPVGFVADPKTQNGQGNKGTLQLVLNSAPLPEKPLVVNNLYTVDLDLKAGWNTITLNYKEGFYRPSLYDVKSKNYTQWSFMVNFINFKTNQPGVS